MTATVYQDKLPPLGFNGIDLRKGSHKDRERGVCAMEAVAWLAGEPHSDSPECACPVISAFIIAWNDALPSDADRNRLLKPVIPRLIGSRSTANVQETRSYLALDWLVRVQMPAWLDLSESLKPHAVALGALDAITNLKTAKAAGATVQAAQSAAAAAGAAAWAVAGAAARDAARAAAWDAAWAAAGDAAWDAAGAAARDAARAAAAAAARDAAWAAAGAAAWAAARAALKPTVEQLQTSALDLIDRMLRVQA